MNAKPGFYVVLSYLFKPLPSGLKSPAQLLPFVFLSSSAGLYFVGRWLMATEPEPQEDGAILLFTPVPKEGMLTASPASQTLGAWGCPGKDRRTKPRHTYGQPRAPPRARQWRTPAGSPDGRSRPEGGPSRA